MNEAGLKDLCKLFFNQNDENKTGAIEYGSELDNLMSDLTPYIFGDEKVSRDEKRAAFNMLDANKDGKIRFDEFYQAILTMYNEND